MTDYDFSRQALLNRGVVLAKTRDPCSSIDGGLRNIMQRREKQRFLESGLSNYCSFNEMVGFDGVSVFLPQPGQSFPVISMMHYLTAQAVKENEGGSDGKVFADLGCGAGFLGNYIAENIEGARRVLFADFQEGSIQASIGAYAFNKKVPLGNIEMQEVPYGVKIQGGGTSLEFKIGDARQTVDEKIDVFMACPKCIPGVIEVFPEAYLVFGEISKKAKGVLYIGHSNLAMGYVNSMKEELWGKAEVVAERRMPLFIGNVDCSNPDKFSYFLSELEIRGYRQRNKAVDKKLFSALEMDDGEVLYHKHLVTKVEF